MITKQLTIINKLGLPARAAAKFVSCASSFSSTVLVSSGAEPVDGKSIMSVMMLAAAKGTELSVQTDGSDEAEAMAAIESLIANRFDEGE